MGIVIYGLGLLGTALCLLANLGVRTLVKRESDRQEARMRREAEERMHPEDLAREFE